MLVSARVFDQNRKIVVEIAQNIITINPNNTFKRKLGKHELAIQDDYGNEILHVRFPNPKTLIVTGVFYKAGFGELIATTGKIAYGEGKILSNNLVECDGQDVGLDFLRNGGMGAGGSGRTPK